MKAEEFPAGAAIATVTEDGLEIGVGVGAERNSEVFALARLSSPILIQDWGRILGEEWDGKDGWLDRALSRVAEAYGLAEVFDPPRRCWDDEYTFLASAREE